MDNWNGQPYWDDPEYWKKQSWRDYPTLYIRGKCRHGETHDHTFKVPASRSRGAYYDRCDGGKISRVDWPALVADVAEHADMSIAATDLLLRTVLDERVRAKSGEARP